jgi:hypothetical protein
MSLKVLERKDVVVILAVAPAGLGHLRVANSLYEGLPASVTPVLLGISDPGLQAMHRITSINPRIRSFAEWVQNGWRERAFTEGYRLALRQSNDDLIRSIKDVVMQRMQVPRVVVVAAAHFGLAHQLSVVKNRLEDELGIKMLIVLQITDDSPQLIWYVPGVDLEIAPSETTKKVLIEYGRKRHLPKVRFEVNGYPISPLLSGDLERNEWERKVKQVDWESNAMINLAIPISGAAVGMDFFSVLVRELSLNSKRFRFHIVSRESPATVKFLQDMANQPLVKVYSSKQDRQVVDLYEEIYQTETISLEVTKPSEQAFKALYQPRERGGSILLLSRPVGRQEYDNLDFLQRHWLLPTPTEHDYMWAQSKRALGLSGKLGDAIKNRSVYWRAIRLPDDPGESADFIYWLLKEGLLLSMMKCRNLPQKFDNHKHELNPNGVGEFWDRVAELVEEKL